jgi:DNA-binding transcriptional regulator YiaG
LAAFVGPKPYGWCVNHKDNNRHNNSVSNIEYTTRSGNNLHAVSTGRVLLGEKNTSARLSDTQAEEIRRSQGVSQSVLAAKFGCSQGLISMIRSGKVRKSTASAAATLMGPAPLETVA